MIRLPFRFLLYNKRAQTPLAHPESDNQHQSLTTTPQANRVQGTGHKPMEFSAAHLGVSLINTSTRGRVKGKETQPSFNHVATC